MMKNSFRLSQLWLVGLIVTIFVAAFLGVANLNNIAETLNQVFLGAR